MYLPWRLVALLPHPCTRTTTPIPHLPPYTTSNTPHWYRYLATLQDVMIDSETYDGATAFSIATAMKHTNILSIVHAQTLALEVCVSVACGDAAGSHSR
jgi:hypothetical protein